ncbi:MAG TPA: response regulator [Caulobacteraceae bacterium]|nr:response regulator [Caulobacteraceae bacterium]
MTSPPAKPAVVVLEDDDSLLGAITFALEEDGFVAHGFRDAGQALAAPATAEADCLIVDLKLPAGPDGLAFIAILRARGQNAPAILITTDPDERTRKAADAAAVTIVEKPLIDGALSRAIERALGRPHD